MMKESSSVVGELTGWIPFTPNDRVVMKMMAGTRDIQFSMDPKP
jgi:hypothetical protein